MQKYSRYIGLIDVFQKLDRKAYMEKRWQAPDNEKEFFYNVDENSYGKRVRIVFSRPQKMTVLRDAWLILVLPTYFSMFVFGIFSSVTILIHIILQFRYRIQKAISIEESSIPNDDSFRLSLVSIQNKFVTSSHVLRNQLSFFCILFNRSQSYYCSAALILIGLQGQILFKSYKFLYLAHAMFGTEEWCWLTCKITIWCSTMGTRRHRCYELVLFCLSTYQADEVYLHIR